MNKVMASYCPVNKKLYVQISTPEGTGLIAYLTPEQFDSTMAEAQKWSQFLKDEEAKAKTIKRNEALKVLQEN